MKHIPNASTRNVRSVWKIGSQGFKGAHYAVFPEELVTSASPPRPAPAT